MLETLKNFGKVFRSSRRNTTSKICLEINNDLSFDAKTNAETFKKFFSNLATYLVNKLPPVPNRFGMDIVKNYYEKYNFDGKFFPSVMQ